MAEAFRPIEYKRAALIVNPKAGGGKHEKTIMRRAEQMADRLHEVHHWDVTVEKTRRPNHASQLAAAAQLKGYYTIIPVGGDGTINEVLQGMLPDGVMGCLPAGTLNLWAREVGIPKNPERAADAIAQSSVTKIDVGQLNDRKFLLMAEIGLTSEVFAGMRRPEGEQNKSGTLAYLAELGRVLKENKPSTDATVVIDGEIIEVNLLQLLMQNTRGYAQISLGHPFADDGMLDVTIGHGKNARSLVIPWLHMIARPGRDMDGITFRQGKSVKITTKQPRYSHIDAEIGKPTTVFDVQVIPKGLHVIVPNGKHPKSLSAN